MTPQWLYISYVYTNVEVYIYFVFTQQIILQLFDVFVIMGPKSNYHLPRMLLYSMNLQKYVMSFHMQWIFHILLCIVFYISHIPNPIRP